jgi:pyridoxal phosphate enzyme (YggS family)
MIADNVRAIRQEIRSEDITLVAVTKTRSIGDIKQLYDVGLRDFGENRVQELADKQAVLPSDIRWHLIGHLQTNKVKYIAAYVHMIHSVDSLKLLVEINKQAERNKRKINCLLQFHIAAETTKFGMNLQEAQLILESDEFKSCHNILISGVMGMATFTKDSHQIRNEFRKLKDIYAQLKEQYFHDHPTFRYLSMGMSDDYLIAISEGSNMIRIGSKLFT